MATEAELRGYARKIITTHGLRNGNPSWEIIEESWDGAPLLESEMDEVYGLWAGASVSVSFDDE